MNRARWNLLGLALASLSLDGLALALDLALPWPRVGGLVWALGWAAVLVALGLWLARWTVRTRGERIAGLLLAAWLLLSLVQAVLPQTQRVGAAWRSANGVQLETLDQGRTLRLHGALAWGDTARVQRELDAWPAVRRVALQLTGGPVPEAHALAELVRARGLDTRASGPCEGAACTWLFMAGKRRELLPEGHLRFQALPAPSLNPAWAVLAQRWQRQQWIAQGLRAAFAERAMLAVAPLGWTPDRFDLEQGGVLSAGAYALDVALPPLPEALPDELRQALRSHTTWLALERKLPGTLEAAVALLQAQTEAGAAPLALHQLALQRERQLLAGASVELRDQYLGLLADELQALSVDADCQALLNGEAAVRRGLSAELARRARVWLEDAATEPPPPPPSRHVVALDREVLQRSLGRAGLQALDQLLPRRAKLPALGCEPARRLLTEVRALPAAQRKPVQRQLFD